MFQVIKECLNFVKITIHSVLLQWIACDHSQLRVLARLATERIGTETYDKCLAYEFEYVLGCPKAACREHLSDQVPHMSPNLAIHRRRAPDAFPLALTPLIVLDDCAFRNSENACYLAKRNREAICSHLINGNANLFTKRRYAMKFRNVVKFTKCEMCLPIRVIKIEVVDRWSHWMLPGFCARDDTLTVAILFIVAIGRIGIKQRLFIIGIEELIRR
jgi:hypothetical protein